VNPSYGITRELPDTDFDTAVQRTTAALKEEGFGVLTEIDVRATLKKKLDVDFPPYLILGTCNPPFAHQALQAEPGIGLLLPCNVIVAARKEGGTTVSAIDPIEAFKIVQREGMEELAGQVRAKLQAAIDKL
jgi:uncharacterized protein (DUF302 family)